MVVKQVSFDIEVYYEDFDLEEIILNLFKQNGIEVLGSSQTNVSEFYKEYKPLTEEKE